MCKISSWPQCQCYKSWSLCGGFPWASVSVLINLVFFPCPICMTCRVRFLFFQKKGGKKSDKTLLSACNQRIPTTWHKLIKPRKSHTIVHLSNHEYHLSSKPCMLGKRDTFVGIAGAVPLCKTLFVWNLLFWKKKKKKQDKIVILVRSINSLKKGGLKLLLFQEYRPIIL